LVGISRSDEGAEALTRAGAEVFRGDVNDLDRLRIAVEPTITRDYRLLTTKLMNIDNVPSPGVTELFPAGPPTPA
jgi:hypothetical protein